MHRDGSGKKIEDLEQAKAEWRASGKSPSTYCSKKEWDDMEDDLGELVMATADGTEIRKHASIKCTARGGSCKVAHNRVIIGNPFKYAAWKASKSAGWMPEWTYYPNSELDEIVARASSVPIDARGNLV